MWIFTSVCAYASGARTGCAGRRDLHTSPSKPSRLFCANQFFCISHRYLTCDIYFNEITFKRFSVIVFFNVDIKKNVEGKIQFWAILWSYVNLSFCKQYITSTVRSFSVATHNTNMDKISVTYSQLNFVVVVNLDSKEILKKHPVVLICLKVRACN